jgi:hypothetical protein
MDVCGNRRRSIGDGGSVIGSDDESGDLLLKNLESLSRSRLLPVSATRLLTNNAFAPTLLMC